MNDEELNEIVNFEHIGKENGNVYWFARDFMVYLGYDNYEFFKKVINKAIAACLTLDINVADNFIQINRNLDNRNLPDYKLTRFACYLIAINGDPKKDKVAKAQIYLAVISEKIKNYANETQNIERLIVREEISDKEKSMVGTAYLHGVINIQFFQNAGYRGLYNKNLNDLKIFKGLKDMKRSLLDFMGKEELAANLFRITQTEAKIRNENIQGQKNIEDTAEHVGKEVRDTMIRISGTKPEDLPLSEDIKKVKKDLKDKHKDYKKLDKVKKKESKETLFGKSESS